MCRARPLKDMTSGGEQATPSDFPNSPRRRARRGHWKSRLRPRRRFRSSVRRVRHGQAGHTDRVFELDVAGVLPIGSGTDGDERLVGVLVGPLGRSLDDLDQVEAGMLESARHDLDVVPVQREVDGRAICVRALKGGSVA